MIILKEASAEIGGNRGRKLAGNGVQYIGSRLLHRGLRNLGRGRGIQIESYTCRGSGWALNVVCSESLRSSML